MPEQRKVRKWRLLILGGFLALGMFLFLRGLGPGAPVPVVYSPETTYVSEPRHSDGSVNYYEIVRKELSEGVTPENNAFLPLLQAVGPACLDAEVRGAFLEQLGLQELPEEGNYLKKPPRADEETSEEVNGARGLDKEAWFRGQEVAISRVVEASTKSRLYLPLVATSTPPRLAYVSIPRTNLLLAAPGTALLARGRWRLDSGDISGAWNDAKAVLRLGCLSGQHVTPIMQAMGVQLRGRACALAARIANSDALKASDLREMLSDLRLLPSFRRIADLIRFERLMALDTSFVVLSGKNALLREVANETDKALKGINPNTLLREVNWAYDLSEAALERKTTPERLQALNEAATLLEESMTRETNATQGLINWVRLLLRGAEERSKVHARLLAYQLLAVIILDVAPMLKIEASADARLAMLHVSLALAAHRSDHGEYPATLEPLVPAYLEAMPQDLFAAAPFAYRRDGKSYKLYSVGPDGKDDGGNRQSDVLIPVPEE